MAELTNNRWVAGEHEFATRIEIADVNGFFSKSLVIEPGTRALFLENGVSVGEAPAGTYVLQNLADKLSFWSRKSTTVIVTRQEELPCYFVLENVSTLELLGVEISLRVFVQIDDVSLFQRNLLGSRPRFSIENLRQTVSPILKQAVREAVSRLSIKDLVSQAARVDLHGRIEQSLRTALTRYGLRFTRVETLSIRHPEFDDQRRRVGELWLYKQETEFNKAKAEAQVDALVERVKQRESLNEIKALAEQVQIDREESQVASAIRRMGVRKELRAAIQANEFDKIKSAEETRRYLEERDKERIIRKDEMDSLTEAIQAKAADRQDLRRHLLAKLDLEQSFEIESVRAALVHADRLREKRFEGELAEVSDTEESKAWKRQIEQEIAEEEHRFTLRTKQMEGEIASARQRTLAETELNQHSLQNQLMSSRVQGEIEIEQAERRRRLALIEVEIKKLTQVEQMELDRRRREMEREAASFETDEQMKRLQMVQKINADYLAQRAQLEDQRLRREAEVQSIKIDSQAQVELNRIKAIGELDKYGKLAVASVENAGILGDVMKTEATQQAAVGIAHAQSQGIAAGSTDKESFYRQIIESERSKADAVADAYTQAMRLQQASFDRFGTVIENALKPSSASPVPPTIIITGQGTPHAAGIAPGGSSHQQPVKIILCPSCRAENNPSDAHCRSCGKSL